MVHGMKKSSRYHAHKKKASIKLESRGDHLVYSSSRAKLGHPSSSDKTPATIPTKSIPTSVPLSLRFRYVHSHLSPLNLATRRPHQYPCAFFLPPSAVGPGRARRP